MQLKQRKASSDPPPKTSAAPVPVSDLQAQFFSRMHPQQPFRQLFEHLPGVFFFAKDEQSRMICGSQALQKRLGVKEEQELVGRPDHDFFPPQIADQFVADDRRVMATREPLIHQVEVWYNENRVLDWYMTNKLPIYDRASRVIGVMGTVQSYEGHRQALAPYGQISRAVEHIRQHHCDPIRVADLAQQVGLSERQLQRKFREAFRMSVQEFVLKARLQAAANVLLKSSRSLADIAVEFGFCDQSAFTHQFRKNIGLTPLKFRRRYGG